MKNIRWLIISISPLLLVIILEILFTISLHIIGVGSHINTFLVNIIRVIAAIIILVKYNKIVIKNPFIINGEKIFQNTILIVVCSLLFFIIKKYINHHYEEETKRHLLQILSVLLIAPWTEEVLFRGWLLGFLKEKGFNVIVAIVISSLLFGLWHYNVMNPNYIPVVYHFFTGVCFGVFYHKFGNLWYSIFAHLIFSLLSVCFL